MFCITSLSNISASGVFLGHKVSTVDAVTHHYLKREQQLATQTRNKYRAKLTFTNKDQKIDAKENKAWREKVIKARQERAKKLKKKSKELAKKIDTNKDGKITKKELEDYKKKLNTKK